MQTFAAWHAELLDPNLGHDVPSWARNADAAREVYESLQTPLPPKAEVLELARLRAEVADLRSHIARLERRERVVVEAVGDALGTIRTGIEHRLTALEARPQMQYKGVWLETADYRPGDIVSCHGGAWACLSACSGTKPGQGSGGIWQLMVKRGADAKPVQPVIR